MRFTLMKDDLLSTFSTKKIRFIFLNIKWGVAPFSCEEMQTFCLKMAEKVTY